MSTTTTGGGHSHAKSHAAHPGGDAAVILWADAASPSLRYVTQDFDPTDTSSSMHVTSLESGAVRGAFSPLESGDGGPQQQHIAQGRGAWARLFSSRA